MMREIDILSDEQALFQKAAEEFTKLASEIVSANGLFNVALSGGSTPRGLYSLLADPSQPYHDHIPWQRLHIFWSDERCVPEDDPESNYRMAYEALLSNVPVLSGNVHRVHTELKDAAAAARDYERSMRLYFVLENGQFPRFDLILLGMGPDGHTASLFPGSPALKEDTKLVTSSQNDKTKIDRVTFTYPVLNAAANVLFLVLGENKADAARKAIEGGPDSDIPARHVQPTDGRLYWLLDRAAAGRLSASTAH